MTDQLYRKATDKEEIHWQKYGARMDMVIPVEIDYEAANQASMSMASRVIFDEDVVVIVNAALGIGGDDEVPGV